MHSAFGIMNSNYQSLEGLLCHFAHLPDWPEESEPERPLGDTFTCILLVISGEQIQSLMLCLKLCKPQLFFVQIIQCFAD